MTERDLKKLNRSDLLEMLLSLSRENELLRKDVEVLQAQLNDRMMTIENAGSLAEAALQLNGVFEAAQSACDQYIQNMQWRTEHQKEICLEMELATKKKCDRMVAEAKLQAAVYKNEAIRKVQEQIKNYAWLYELIGNPLEDYKKNEDL